jgi:hypothetical protein
MAEKFRSVLEKYDAKGNRSLPTPEEQAIERDTTLEGLLIGPGKAAASAIKNVINKKATSRKFDTPKIGSGLDPWKNVGFNKKPREILAEQEARGNKASMVRAAERAHEKGIRQFFGEASAVIADKAQKKLESDNNEDQELKKGGKVSASSRADGIAARGKTRGKIY